MADEYGPVVTLDRLAREIKADNFHPRRRLLLQQFVLLTSNANLDYICDLILYEGRD